MACDGVIQTGTVVDGTRRPSSRADVAVQGDRIAAVGAVSGPAKRTIDADGHLVTPGFIGLCPWWAGWSFPR